MVSENITITITITSVPGVRMPGICTSKALYRHVNKRVYGNYHQSGYLSHHSKQLASEPELSCQLTEMSLYF